MRVLAILAFAAPAAISGQTLVVLHIRAVLTEAAGAARAAGAIARVENSFGTLDEGGAALLLRRGYRPRPDGAHELDSP
jgi:hypothetical protein